MNDDIDAGALDEIVYWLRARAEAVIETHAAWVFLVGPNAYKLKKAVNLGYLDFSTPEKREAAIRRELELNKPTAPDIYLSVTQVTREADGSKMLGGRGAKLEAVLKMRRFDPKAVLSNRPETVKGGFADHLGRTVARFHAGAEIAPDGGGSAMMRFVLESNASHVRRLDALKGEAAERLIARTDAALAAVEPLLERRRTDGFARRCHGDMHLGNIVVLDGQPVLFDCIEFNDALARIDVLYDLAFLLMDLTFQGQAAGAVRVLNGWLDQSAREGGDAVYEGLAALPLFLSVRACVRAHVSAQMGEADRGRAYLDAALNCLEPAPAALLAIGGVSGTGKSTVARAVAPTVGPAPGAVILRSDEIRKRLWNVGPTERLGPEAYAPEQSERIYGRMLEEAALALKAGRGVILDAVFLRPEERAAAEAVAAAVGVPFTGVWLEAPEGILAERIGARTGDASDADAAVMRRQLARGPGELDWNRVDASGDAAALVRRLAGAEGRV